VLSTHTFVLARTPIYMYLMSSLPEFTIVVLNLSNQLWLHVCTLLLQAAYRLKDHVVGLQHTESGVVVPVSLACSRPEVLAQGAYALLLSEREIDWDKQAAASEATARQGQVQHCAFIGC
jgi:hypothetical protein